MQPSAIQSRVDEVRGGTNGAFQMNLSMPDPPPHCDPVHEAQLRAFLFAACFAQPQTPLVGSANSSAQPSLCGDRLDQPHPNFLPRRLCRT